MAEEDHLWVPQQYKGSLDLLYVIYGKQPFKQLKIGSGREYGTASIDIHIKTC